MCFHEISEEKAKMFLKKTKLVVKKRKQKLVFGSVAQLIRPALPIFWGLGLPIFEA